MNFFILLQIKLIFTKEVLPRFESEGFWNSSRIGLFFTYYKKFPGNLEQAFQE